MSKAQEAIVRAENFRLAVRQNEREVREALDDPALRDEIKQVVPALQRRLQSVLTKFDYWDDGWHGWLRTVPAISPEGSGYRICFNDDDVVVVRFSWRNFVTDKACQHDIPMHVLLDEHQRESYVASTVNDWNIPVCDRVVKRAACRRRA